MIILFGCGYPVPLAVHVPCLWYQTSLCCDVDLPVFGGSILTHCHILLVSSLFLCWFFCYQLPTINQLVNHESISTSSYPPAPHWDPLFALGQRQDPAGFDSEVWPATRRWPQATQGWRWFNMVYAAFSGGSWWLTVTSSGYISYY